MANTLTDLAADIYTAADVVGREQVGFIKAVTMNANTARAAKGDTIRAAFTQASTVQNVSELMQIPEGDAQTVDNKTMTISKSRAVQIPYTGEEQLHLRNGAGYETVYGDQIAQAMRALTNEIETDLYVEASKNAYLAFGDNATDAFSSNLDNVVDARSALIAEGCPSTDLQMVLSSSAAASLRKKGLVTEANKAGTDDMIRNGVLLPFYGIDIRETGASNLISVGGDASGAINATEALGQTELTVDGYSQAVGAGEVITIAGDTNQYVVNTATTSLITINGAGLKVATTDGDAITSETGSYSHNLVFHRSAIELVSRAPALPVGGDAADDAITVQDPISGLVFEVRTYRGYRKSMIEVAMAFGVKAFKSDFISSVLHSS